MDDMASVGKISASSDSVSTLNSEDFVLVSRLGDETPSTNNGSDDEKTGLKVRPLTEQEFLETKTIIDQPEVLKTLAGNLGLKHTHRHTSVV